MLCSLPCRASFPFCTITPTISEYLAMADILMIGPVDGSVFQPLTRLRYLDIGDNEFNSTLPQSIASLPNLKSLYACNCNLQGELEDLLPQMTNLHEVWMDDNFELAGTIPASIGGLTKLKSLSISNCDLKGTIPPELGNLSNLQQLWLYGNWLSGTVPSEIGLLSDLAILGIEDNNLTNAMPQEVCDLNLLALSSDCGEFEYLQCDCCTCCESPCPIHTIKLFGGRLLFRN
jgi:Leucine-rich repeat (LRR) protein